MPERIELTVPTALAGRRLDQTLAMLLPEYSRNRLQHWIEAGAVTVDGVVTEGKRKLRGGEILRVTPQSHPSERAWQAEAIALNIVYEDEFILVLDKPAGRVVHPGAGNWEGTLLNALLHHAPELEQVPRAGIVHRLDKDTSGLMVVARTLAAQTQLVRDLQARAVTRLYWAVAAGCFAHLAGEVNAPIGRHPTQRVRMAVVPGGKPARTHYRVLRQYASCAWVECRLETGRTHQIRVHLAHLGHPLLGDPLYAGRGAVARAFSRQALHAFRLGLVHPASGKSMQWESPMPADFADLIARLDSGASL